MDQVRLFLSIKVLNKLAYINKSVKRQVLRLNIYIYLLIMKIRKIVVQVYRLTTVLRNLLLGSWEGVIL